MKTTIETNAPSCQTAAWRWLTLGTPKACPPPPPVNHPCAHCGHAWAEHDYEDGFGASFCLDHTCGCMCFERPGNVKREATELRTDATCEDSCTCPAHHGDGAHYYVSVIRDGNPNDARLVLGPFSTHGAALGFVRLGEMLGRRLDARAAWYAFGTVALANGDAKGMLNDMAWPAEPDVAAVPERSPRSPAKRHARARKAA